ncbi:hypothetical protein FHS10_001772 [Mucilaginibacter dorajii]|nr:hypothetical protein [Mucilaginibacter dorajii]
MQGNNFIKLKKLNHYPLRDGQKTTENLLTYRIAKTYPIIDQKVL